MRCPTCGSDCIKDPQEILDGLFQMYMACSSCPPDPIYDKNAPLYQDMDSMTGKCITCGKRHLDHVMGHVLTLVKKSGILPREASLKDVGIPLIAFGYQVPYPPRLMEKSLVIIMDTVTEELAGIITANVQEIKGVVKRKGPPSKSVGLCDIDSTPHTYELLSGCDMRCDIVSSTFGELCIYKNQSTIHIEFNNTKIKKIEAMYMRGELDDAVVVDGFCGPGTLGMLCALGGASKVILNDAWLPAIRNTILNIRANSSLLGVEIEFEQTDFNNLIGDEPLLMAKARGKTEILVYHADIRKLASTGVECDICLIDTFPSVNPADYLSVCRDFAKKTVII